MEILFNGNGSFESNSWEKDVDDWMGIQPNDVFSKMSLWTMTDIVYNVAIKH